jgi:hypothetical protein
VAWQLQDGFGVRRREAAVGGVQQRQPGMRDVFARGQRDGNVARDADGKDVFGVPGDAGGVAVAPGRVNLVDVRDTPVAQDDGLAVGNDAGFFEQLAGGGQFQGFIKRVEGAGDGLPEAGAVGALDEEDFQVGGVDDDQDGDGDFVRSDDASNPSSRRRPGPIAPSFSVISDRQWYGSSPSRG